MTYDFANVSHRNINSRTDKKMRKEKIMSNWKKLFTFILTATVLTAAQAQTPSWAAKAAKSVFTLKTFGTDGSLLASTTGFFIADNGEAVSSYTPFRGAQRAVVIDAAGKEWPVACLTGANETYDVAKFRVNAKKPSALVLADTAASNGDEIWMLPYSANKKPQATKATVKSSETFMDTYQYYTIEPTTPNAETGTPILNAQGEVVGLTQPSSNTQQALIYAVSAPFAASLKLNGLSPNDPVFQATGIALAVPESLNDALLALIVSRNAFDEQRYTDFVTRFTEQFPTSADGYVSMAGIAVSHGQYEAADDYLQQAVRKADNKADAHYRYAQTVFQYCLQDSAQTFAAWTLDKALDETRAAYKEDAQSIYRQQEAQILYVQQQYDEAFNVYRQLTTSDLRSADIFFAAAQCKAMAKDTTQQLALLDSAVALFNKPYLKEAAPYLLARAQARHEAGKFRQAVADYNEYGSLMATQLNAHFYYLREQSEVAGRLYQQALNDIDKAVEMEPQATLYLAEKTALLVHVSKYPEAVEVAKKLITLDPNNSDGYYFLGAAQWLSDNKTEGMTNLQKAKQMGNSAVQIFMDRHTQ